MAKKRKALHLCALCLAGSLAASVHAASDSCGTLTSGFLLGSFNSDTSRGITVCVTPARDRCNTCDFSRSASNCDNIDCTTVTCYCGVGGADLEVVFWDGFGTRPH